MELIYWDLIKESKNKPEIGKIEVVKPVTALPLPGRG